ncbi:esterase family protein, partial [Parabacteroides sp. OttesenSCG-928-N08]|nr:esterase family protein [Parabacteroides sp. OttesenSCG-928-N08]
MRRKGLLMVMTLLVSLSIMAQFPGWGAQSKIVTDSIESKVLGAYRQFTIFLPKSYEVETAKEYPILYLLHGMMDTNSGWTMRGHLKDVMDQLVDSGEVCEMIIVTPNAGGNIYEGVWNGYFDMPGWSYETFFYTEFLPYIESNYRVIG